VEKLVEMDAEEQQDHLRSTVRNLSLLVLQRFKRVMPLMKEKSRGSLEIQKL